MDPEFWATVRLLAVVAAFMTAFFVFAALLGKS